MLLSWQNFVFSELEWSELWAFHKGHPAGIWYSSSFELPYSFRVCFIKPTHDAGGEFLSLPWCLSLPPEANRKDLVFNFSSERMMQYVAFIGEKAFVLVKQVLMCFLCYINSNLMVHLFVGLLLLFNLIITCVLILACLKTPEVYFVYYFRLFVAND